MIGTAMDWAKKEVEIACQKENPNRKEGEVDYECACYESALKAFESLCNDKPSGYTLKRAQSILNQLIDLKPLTPIEDTDDSWTEILSPKECHKVYQCNRLPSLFKCVYDNGTIEYHDTDRTLCVNIHNPNDTYSSVLARLVVDDMFPITMPYMPGDRVNVYCEDFLVDEPTGDFYTTGLFYAVKTENGETKRVEINRFFKEKECKERGKWTEINEAEYYERKSMKIKNYECSYQVL